MSHRIILRLASQGGGKQGRFEALGLRPKSCVGVHDAKIKIQRIDNNSVSHSEFIADWGPPDRKSRDWLRDSRQKGASSIERGHLDLCPPKSTPI